VQRASLALNVSFIAYVGQGELTPAGYENAYRQAVAKFDYGTMTRMRTTVDIPDGMYRQLKARARRAKGARRGLSSCAASRRS